MLKFQHQVEQNGEGMETISMGGGVAQVMLQGGGEAQVLQVLSLKEATVLSKAMVSIFFFCFKEICFNIIINIMITSRT